ncbi:hypothetical protein G7054_g7720 [Neopestalotiopsis clavispora]|nr:hypothetical protein G7054_g7720 [Neopestalotiopsis clavispora]
MPLSTWHLHPELAHPTRLDTRDLRAAVCSLPGARIRARRLKGVGAMEAEPSMHASQEPSSQRPKLKKVRTGCRVCKRRKIKCDEQKPSCRNCIKHSAVCDYAGAVPEAAAGPNGGRPSGVNGPSTLEQQASPEPMSLNPVHLELLHNYTTATCYTLSAYVPLRTMWRINVPRLGFTTSFVMRAVLALSALHLSRLQPSKADFYLSIARSEHQVAMRTATELLRNVTAGNCSALFIFSLITFFYTVASPRASGHMLLFDGSGILDWLVILRGLRHISDAATEELLAGPFAAAVAFGRIKVDQTRLRPASTSSAWNSTAEHKQLATLRQLISRTVSDLQSLATYVETVDILETCFLEHQSRLPTMDLRALDANDSSATSDVKETTTVFTWPYLVSGEYMEMLGQRQDVALVILAHYCVLLQSLNGCWWMHGWPAYLVKNIWQALNGPHRLWIQWPMEEIGWQPDDW